MTTKTKRTGPDTETNRTKERQVPMGLAATPASDEEGAQTIAALARGLDVLAAYQVGDRSLGNQELADRTGLPKATVSRITYTLAQGGFLTFNQRERVYGLGSRAIRLGLIAVGDAADVRKMLRPLLQALADDLDLDVGLGIRDGADMMYVDTANGKRIVGMNVYPGFRMPIPTSSFGRAYLAVLDAVERERLLQSLHLSERAELDRQIASMAERGFVTSIGHWEADINAAAVAFRIRDQIYSVNAGGAAYLATPDIIDSVIGPRLARFCQDIDVYTNI